MATELEKTSSKSKLNRWLIELRDDAVNGNASFHKTIKQEQVIYNEAAQAYRNDSYVGQQVSFAKDTIQPMIPKLVNTVHPRLDEGSPRPKYLPDREGEDADKSALVQTIGNYVSMYDEVDMNTQWQHIANFHVLVGGMAIRKVIWDCDFDRLSCPAISPLTFFPDPRGTHTNLANMRYIVQGQREPVNDLKRFYGFRRKRNSDGKFDKNTRIDEIWLQKYMAQEHVDAKRMVKATLIDDKLVDIEHTPWWYPDYPYACWRNFLIYDDSGKPNQFWGFGFAKFLWKQQKLLDELLANLILIIRNLSVGKFLSKKGALDMEQVPPTHGLNIEIEDGFELSDILNLPPEQVPPILLQFIQYIVDIIESTSGINPVFSGEAPFAGVSGRAVAALQSAAFTHISNLIRGLIDFVERLARIKGVFVQQMARRPIHPHLWRGGIDIRGQFPEGARHVGFRTEVHDTSNLPQNPAARFEVGKELVGLGLKPEKFLDVTGIGNAYGVKPEDFLVNLAGVGTEPNTEVLAGTQV